MLTRVDSVADIIPNRAQGYRRTEGGELRNSPLADNSYKVPGGGFVSTAEDLAKFAVAVETYKLLKRETTEQMFTSQKTKDGKETRYGLGWGVGTHAGTRAIGHSGAQQRVSTILNMLPDRGLAVAVLANVEENINDLLEQSQVLRHLVENRELAVVGAFYELGTGRALFSEPVVANSNPSPGDAHK